MTEFTRRTILIKKRFQYKYMAVVFFSVLIAFLIIGLDVSYTLSKILSYNPGIQPLLDRMSSVFPLLAMKFFIYLVIILIVSGIISHRIAGPIFRFEKSARIIGTGDLTHRVTLRSGDEWLELQEEFNQMVIQLQSKIQKEKTLIRHLCAHLDEIAKRLSQEKHQEISALKRELEHITSGFKA
ncbi:MAG: HAMP domain-containing protein [Elusimicrobia bacterium]|nr:HAMP domain-containing protein [Elusimicrobiota bacterium]